MKAFSAEPAPAETVLHVWRAGGFLARARGLLARPAVAPGCGLLLQGVNAVHGFGMRWAIDLVFLDRRGTIVRCGQLAPWQVARCAAASDVLEMRAGEAERLQLQLGSRPELRPVEDIFRPPGSERHDPSQPGECGSAVAPSRRRLLRKLRTIRLMVVAVAAMPAPDAAAAEAQVSAGAAFASPASAAAPGAPPLDAPVLRRFEFEAEALYRDSAPHVADAELVRLYEALATAAPQRRPHAWLRIGNIHQRAGAVGAAVDAYRKALQASDAAAQQGEAEASRRKALLNLAALALEQARQALAHLPPALPAVAGQAEQLKTLVQQLDRYAPLPPATLQQPRSRQSSPSPPPPLQHRQPPELAQPAAAPGDTPHVVERYTASARRNAVKAARGSLHVDPDDELPARPVARPRGRARERDRLPDIEYLLGDPQRPQKTSRAREAAGARK